MLQQQNLQPFQLDLPRTHRVLYFLAGAVHYKQYREGHIFVRYKSQEMNTCKEIQCSDCYTVTK